MIWLQIFYVNWIKFIWKPLLIPRNTEHWKVISYVPKQNVHIEMTFICANVTLSSKIERVFPRTMNTYVYSVYCVLHESLHFTLINPLFTHEWIKSFKWIEYTITFRSIFGIHGHKIWNRIIWNNIAIQRSLRSTADFIYIFWTIHSVFAIYVLLPFLEKKLKNTSITFELDVTTGRDFFCFCEWYKYQTCALMRIRNSCWAWTRRQTKWKVPSLLLDEMVSFTQPHHRKW